MIIFFFASRSEAKAQSRYSSTARRISFMPFVAECIHWISPPSLFIWG